ncbi:MAG TPA: hypothetical protein VFX43_21870 [Chitinophagaceae bacterium]|jgi:hypothetical protein|nr:hypothetical protein [Chitinophagaceae bacterium]
MEDNFKGHFTGSKKLITQYLEARWKLLRLTAAGKVANALGFFFGLMLTALLGFFVVLFLGFLLAYWIADMTGSFMMGFLLTSIFFILLFIIVLIFRRGLIQRPLANIIIREIAEDIEEDLAERQMEKEMENA